MIEGGVGYNLAPLLLRTQAVFVHFSFSRCFRKTSFDMGFYVTFATGVKEIIAIFFSFFGLDIKEADNT